MADALRMLAAEASSRPGHHYVEIGVFTGWTCSLVSAFLWCFTDGRLVPGLLDDDKTPWPFSAYAVNVSSHRLSSSTRALWQALNVRYVDVHALPGVLAKLRSVGERFDGNPKDGGTPAF